MSNIVGHYQTKSGKDAIVIKEIKIGERVSYSWMGTYGAGCCSDKNEYLEMVAEFKRTKRGLQTLIELK